MPTEFPYLTILETKCKPLEVIEEKLTADAAPYPWYNETLCNVNNSVVCIVPAHLSAPSC